VDLSGGAQVFDWDFLIACFPELTDAFLITISAAILGFLFASIIGLIVAVIVEIKVPILHRALLWGNEFVRGTPLLVQMFFLFYVLPDWGINLGPMQAGILALGIHYASYCSEAYRSGIRAIPKSQWDATKALNLGLPTTLRAVILPQMFRVVTPMLGNYLIAIFKDTPLLSAITVVEVLQVAKILGANNFKYLEPLTAIGFLFLLVSLVAAYLVRKLERKLELSYA
jgi:polar amino acid transport system permease protein